MLSLSALAAAMGPLDTVLAVTALAGFILAVVGFLALIWKISWAIRGWVSAQERVADRGEEALTVLREFVATQRESNESVVKAMQAQADRLNYFDAEREDLHMAVRAMSRKLNYLEGENAGPTKQHTA